MNMIRNLRTLVVGLGLSALLLGGLESAQGTMIGVDQILIEQNDPGDLTNPYSTLKAKVGMTISGQLLTVTLTDLTPDPTGLPGYNVNAGWALTAVGFQLPSGVTIDSSGAHSVSAVSYFPSGSTAVTTQDWGYANTAKGAFSPVTTPGVLAINAAIATLAGDVTNNLANGGGNTVGGVDYGVINTEGVAPAGKQPYIEDLVTVSVQLLGTVPTGLLSQIDAGNVVVAYGSANAVIPEPATFAIWSAFGVAGIGLHQWRRRRKK
jgi:hypothetical protein